MLSKFPFVCVFVFPQLTLCGQQDIKTQLLATVCVQLLHIQDFLTHMKKILDMLRSVLIQPFLPEALVIIRFFLEAV